MRDRQQQNSFESFKDASWPNQQFYSPQSWNMPKKVMDDFEKIISKSNKMKCVEEQILIVHLELGFEEAHHSCSRCTYDYSAVELLEHFLKSLSISQQKETPLEHPRLPEFPTLGTLTGDVDEYYSEQETNDNQLILKALGER